MPLVNHIPLLAQIVSFFQYFSLYLPAKIILSPFVEKFAFFPGF